MTMNAAMAGEETGVVKWFSEAKGFGYITLDSGGGDIFVHWTGIERNGRQREKLNLHEGDEVSFRPGAGTKGRGPKAVNVKVLRAAK